MEGRGPAEGKAGGNACPGLCAGPRMSLASPAYGSELQGLPSSDFRSRLTFGRSPVRESRTPGSEGEVPGNRHLYPTDAEGDDRGEAYTASLWGVGASHERNNIAGAETFTGVEGNMCGAVMRGSDALPGSRATSRKQGTRRNLGDLLPGRVATSRAGPHREGEEP